MANERHERRDQRIRIALAHVRQARDLLRTVAPRAADRVGGTIKSIEGARRHAVGMATRERVAQEATPERVTDDRLACAACRDLGFSIEDGVVVACDGCARFGALDPAVLGDDPKAWAEATRAIQRRAEAFAAEVVAAAASVRDVLWPGGDPDHTWDGDTLPEVERAILLLRPAENVPPCAAAMACLCAMHAIGAPADAACNASEEAARAYAARVDEESCDNCATASADGVVSTCDRETA